MARKLTKDEINKRFATLHNGEYTLVSEYINNSTEVTIKHIPCGHTFKLKRLTKFFNDSNYEPCPYCRTRGTSELRWTKESLSNKVNELYNNQFEVVSFTKMHAPVVLKCNKCGHIFSKRGSDILNTYKFAGCPNCRENKRGIHQHDDNYLEHALEEAPDGKEYKWLDKYSGNPKDKHKIQHLTCGHIYEVKPVNFRYCDKNRCPYCARKKSKNEETLYSELAKYIPDLIQSDRHEINPYELDIFSPSYKIAIEYNGLFWHNEEHKGKKYHEEKRKKCEEKGIRLIQIYEDEWINHHDIVLSKVLSIFKKYKYANIIYARKCTCKQVTDYSEISKFYNENHIQGMCAPAAATFGLYYNGKLVALGSFNKLRKTMNFKNISDGYDMIRYATLLDTHVIGGCGKIISTFVKTMNCKYIKTIADLRWSASIKNMYTELGFKASNYIEPRYYYTDGENRFPRFTFRKSEIKRKFPDIYDEKLTEFEMMNKTKYHRIWDAGKITYEKYF